MFSKKQDKLPKYITDYFETLKSDPGTKNWATDDFIGFARGCDIADESLEDFIKTTDSSKISLENYETYLNKSATATSKFSKVTSGLKTLAKGFGAGLLNMGVGLLAGAAITGIIKLIDEVVHREERLIEAGEKAKSAIDETFSSFSEGKSSLDSLGQSFSENGKQIESTGEAIDSVAKKYTELSKGVNTLSNANKSLSDDEYQQYLDISNQLAEQFPSLVSGYDSQGNAILNLGQNADTAAQSLRELYEAQMLSANVEIGNQLDDNYKGISTSVKQYQEENDKWNKQIEKNKKTLESLKMDPVDLTDGGVIEFDPNALGESADKLSKEVHEILSDSGIAHNKYISPEGVIQINTSGIDEKTAKEISRVSSKYTEDAIESLSLDNVKLEKQVSANEQLIKDQWNSMSDSISKYLQTSDTFTSLNKSLQDAFLGNMDELNTDAISEKYNGDVEKFLYHEFLTPMSQLKPEVQSQIADLLSIDYGSLDFNTYKKTVDDMLRTAFPTDKKAREQFKASFGFDDIIEEATTKFDTLKDIYGDAVNDLSLDELEAGYDLIVNDKFTGTFDELKNKLEESQALAAVGIDLEANTNFENIVAADETKNAGDDYKKAVEYLTQAKEMFDQGLIGTDDFKTRAAYFSPTGAEDAVNFAENYAKAARYLTEDGSGVQKFLYDLESKGYASLEQMADGTQKWTYNLNDLEKAATDIGIGFEFFMDMMGRLEDYGFSNNFVGSLEDGQQKIQDISKELVDAKAELASLKSTGADQTAIDQQRLKVQGLENDLRQATDALSQFMNKSAEDYNKQVEAAKQSITSLVEERKRILAENTYGDNTQAVANLMEEQIQQWASENGLVLDANLNIVNKEEEAQNTANAINSAITNLGNIGDFSDNKHGLYEHLSSLETNQVIEYTADVNDVETTVTALKEEDGTIKYTANIDGVEQELKPQLTADGTLKYRIVAEDEASGVIDEVNKKELITKTCALISEDHATGIINLWNSLEADPQFTSLNAVDQATYVISLWNSLSPKTQTAIITASDESASDTAGKVTGAVESIPKNPNINIGADDNASGVIGLVNNGLLGLNGTTAHTYIYTHHINTSKGEGKLTGTAHLNGTAGLYPIPKLSGRALAMGTLQDESWLNPNWRTKHDEVALTGEVGEELVVIFCYLHVVIYV